MALDNQAVTKQDLTEVLAQYAAEISAQQDRAIEAIATEISGPRQEMNRRFEEMDRRFEEVDRSFEQVDRQMDRMGEILISMDSRMTALSRWAERLDRDNPELHSTQVAQKRAVDELAARVASMEEELHLDQR